MIDEWLKEILTELGYANIEAIEARIDAPGTHISNVEWRVKVGMLCDLRAKGLMFTRTELMGMYEGVKRGKAENERLRAALSIKNRAIDRLKGKLDSLGADILDYELIEFVNKARKAGSES